MFLKKLKNKKMIGDKGSIMLYAVIFGLVAFSVVVIGVTSYASFENRASIYKHNREMAFQVAEAGANYYRWHLAHNKTDFYDGTATSGPYIHDYKDKDGNVIGYFSLKITPPVNSSTIVVVESTGWLANQPQSARMVRVRLGFPALTDYAFLTREDVWIGRMEYTHGKFHASGGIRFDGIGDAPITSATPTYICKEHHGCGNQLEPGIWGQGGPQDYWSFPVPDKDFSAVTAKLADIKNGATTTAGGLYLTSSGKQGWRISFQSNGTIKVYKVNTTNCYNGKDVDDNRYHSYCIDIASQSTTTTYPMPTSTFIYVEDNVWVDGTVKGRATIGTATGKNIIINSSTVYYAKDGNHVLGLVSENNILIPHDSPEQLEIDAALLAQHGACKRYYYPGNTRDHLTIYGAVLSAGVWTWNWTSGGSQVTSGYEITDTTYDANLTYSPPSGFPVGSEYNLISWERVQ